jgi:ABC-type branched-subunit amino acid transport system substrate-binding protein
VAHPGNEQGAQWLQIRQENPDYVIFWGWGVMNQTALKAAQKVGYPRDKMIGSWWAGSEEDTVPAGDAAKGYMSATWNVAGKNVPVIATSRRWSTAPARATCRTQQARLGALQPRRVGHGDRGSHPHGAGEVRQGQGDDRRAMRWAWRT